MINNPLHQKWIKMGYDSMPPLNFECSVCKLPSALKEPPKENMLYRCDNCLTYFVFYNIQEDDYQFTMDFKRVKFKTKQMEKERLEQHKG
jgi:hypothetical protein